MQSTAPAPPARSSPFGQSGFRRLFLAHAVSVLGDRLVPVVLAFAVLGMSSSISSLGVVIGAQFLPVVVLTLAGGAIGDRMSRQALIVGTHLVRCCCQTIMAWTLITGTAAVWSLTVLQLVNGAAIALAQPVFWSFVPEVVDRDGLRTANASLNLIDSLASVFGPSLGGVLLLVAEPGWGIGFDAATFLVAAVLIAGLPVRPRTEQPAERTPVLRSVRLGWSYVRQRRWLLFSIVSAGVFQLVVLAPLSVLGPVVSDTALGGATAWAQLSAALGIGAATGSALCLRWHPRRPLGAAFAVSLLAGPVLALLAFPAPLWTLLVAQFAGGAALAIFDTWWMTVVQHEVPAELLGRVMSFDLLGSVALRPIGLFAVGSMVTLMGVGPLLFTGFAVNFLVTLAGVLTPRVWAIRRP